MATKTVNISGFNLRSTWTYRGVNYPPDEDPIWYNPTTPSTASKTVSVDLSSIPSGSRVTSATLSIATNGSGGSAAVCNNISVNITNNHTGANAVDVTSWFSSLGSTASIRFTFQAYSAPSTSSSSSGGASCTFSDSVLTINYELPSSSGSFNVSSVEAGASSSITMTISPVNLAYTHTVVWTFGNETSTSTLAAGVTTATWNIPLSFCNQIPNATSGTASAVLTTYNNGTAVGNPVTYTFTITVPASVVPTAGSLSSSPVTTGAPASWSSIYVQGFSIARMTLPSVSGAYGSTISSVVFSGTGWSVNGTASGTSYVGDSAALTTSGTNTLKAIVTDSRGRTCQKTLNVTVTSYSTPRISSATVRRCNSSGTLSETGTNALVTVVFSYASVGGNNVATTASWYQINSMGTWNNGTTGYTSNVAFKIGNDDMGADHTHNIKVTISDSVGNSVTSVITLPTATYVLHFKNGGTSVAVGQAATDNTTFVVNPTWDAYIGGLNVKKFPLHLEYKRDINANEDFNSFLEYGMYGVASDNIAATLSNRPCEYGGLLYVISSQFDERSKTIADSTYCRLRQIYLTSYVNDIYIRTVRTEATAGAANVTYGTWTKVVMGELSADAITGTLGVGHGGTGVTSYDSLRGSSALDIQDKVVAGDYVTFPSGTCFAGLITSSQTQARFSLPIGRYIAANSVSIIEGKGYLLSSSGKEHGTDAVNITNMGTVTFGSLQNMDAYQRKSGTLTMQIDASSSFSGSNNRPATLCIDVTPLKLYFT